MHLSDYQMLYVRAFVVDNLILSAIDKWNRMDGPYLQILSETKPPIMYKYRGQHLISEQNKEHNTA